MLIGTLYAIAQGQDGVLWVGTRNGLASFDGSPFKSHKEYGRVNALAVDTEGRLWIGTAQERVSALEITVNAAAKGIATV